MSPQYSAMNLLRTLVFGGASLLLGLAVISWLDDPNGESIPATLQAQTTAVSVGQNCQLLEIFVRPGDQVTPNQPLLRLGDDRLETQRASKERELDELKSELSRAEAAAAVELAWRRREIEKDIFDTQQQASSYKQEQLHHQVAQIAWEEHLRNASRWAGDSADDLQVLPLTFSESATDTGRLLAVLKEDAAAAAAEALGTKIGLCEQRLISLNKMAAELDQKVRISAGVEVAKTRLLRAEAELEAISSRLAALTVVSPGYGTVGNIQLQPGDRLNAGDVVLELLDEAQLSLTAQLPSALAGSVAQGQQLTVLFPGEQRRAGRIATLPPQTLSSPIAGPGDSHLALRIQPAGKLWPKLPIGTQVSVVVPRSAKVL